MKKFFIGFAVGIILTLVIVLKFGPPAMIKVVPSKLSFDQTVSKIENSILDHEWEIQRIYEIDECMRNFGYNTNVRVVTFSICKPDNVNEILSKDKNMFITAIMPCRLAVFQDREGKVNIASMNIKLMGQLFGGDISKVTRKVAADEKSIITKALME